MNATFKDKTGQEWKIELDVILIEEVKTKHGVNLVGLEADPLVKLRNDLLILAAVVHILCQDSIEERNVDATQFGKQLPHPDELLEAVAAAIVNFSPAGRRSHVQDALKKYQEMANKTDEMTLAQMEKILSPQRLASVSQKVDEEVQRKLDEMLNSKPAT